MLKFAEEYALKFALKFAPPYGKIRAELVLQDDLPKSLENRNGGSQMGLSHDFSEKIGGESFKSFGGVRSFFGSFLVCFRTIFLVETEKMFGGTFRSAVVPPKQFEYHNATHLKALHDTSRHFKTA